MPADRISALAIHVCADAVTRGSVKRWPPTLAAPDTLRRAVRICEQLGVGEQRILAGDQATIGALGDALLQASVELAADGLLVLTFSGHTERGDGPVEAARWCLVDGGVALSAIAQHLARLPAAARLVIVCGTCHASAITEVLVGRQPAVVLASCSDDQTMIDRPASEFMVRLEDFVCAGGRQGSLEDLRAVLEADTPDCERPVVWSNAADAWPVER